MNASASSNRRTTVSTAGPIELARPWYREPWPWLLMAGPAIVIVAGAFTTWLAVSSADGVVADDYYRRGLAINQELKRERAAQERSLDAQVEVDGRRLRVRLSGALLPDIIFARLVHATRAGFDQRLRLAPVAPGVYETELAELPGGRWSLILEDARGEWRIVKEHL